MPHPGLHTDAHPASLPEMSADEKADIKQTLLDCSIVVGMHPDEATEPMIDFAIELGKPWAVVPCCVFGHEFPDRKLASGAPVQSYEDFAQYLLEKNSRCKSVFLAFHGKNQVIYDPGRPGAGASAE